MTQSSDPRHADSALFPDSIACPEVWPIIRSIEDVRPFVDPARGIHLFEDGPFIVCRYTSSLPETFQTAMDLECRCMIFDKQSGNLLSRTFQKFFNKGERQTLDDLDIKDAWLEHKLDGTMIGAFVYMGVVYYHTRGGLSKHAKAAQDFASSSHDDLVRDAFSRGFTPIFEYTSPDNRVVIPYAAQSLTLLALRHRKTGDYDPNLANKLAARYGVPITETLGDNFSSPDSLARCLDEIVAREDIEGVVLVLPDGHRLKIKTQDYMRRHKILANIAREKYAYLCYLEDVLDDTAAALGGDRGRALTCFVEELDKRLNDLCNEIATDLGNSVAAMKPQDRARHIKNTYSGILQAAAFAVVAGTNPKERLKQIMGRRIHSPEKRAEIIEDLGLPHWSIDIHALR